MIEYLDRQNIDDHKWDQCIARSFNGMLYGYTWYLDIVSEDWGGLIENDYESVFPLPGKNRFGISFIYQPFFTQQLGLFSRNLISEEKVGMFIKSIPDSFRRVDLNMNTLNKINEEHFECKPQLNHELDLIHPYETTYSGYSENLKRNIKKAKNANLQLIQNIKPDGIIKLFREGRGAGIKHLKDSNYLIMKRILYTAMYKRNGQMIGVFNNTNELIAGAAFIVSNKKAIFIFSGLGEEGKKKGAMPFLIDAFIRNNSGNHLTLDFNGSNDPNLARFYKSFGSKECIYHRVNLDRLPKVTSALLDFGRKVKGWT